MDLDEIESQIGKIVKIVEKIPERYRDKCFEILINRLVDEKEIKQDIPQEAEVQPPIEKQEGFDFQIPIEARAFFRQFELDEGRIYELFLITGKDEVVPVYKIKTTIASKAQIQISLMTALENTLKQTGKFEFELEDIRKRCQDNKCYNQKNFVTNFNNNKKLFKEINEQHGFLSPYGKEKLAEVINDL